MKYIALLALFAVAVNAGNYSPPDPSERSDCFETAPGQVFCMSDGTLVCGRCGALEAYCLALFEGKVVWKSKDPKLCRNSPIPACEPISSRKAWIC